MATMPNRAVSKSHIAVTAEMAALETRPPRVRYTTPVLPSLPNLPTSKPGRDALTEADFLWAQYPESYRTAHLLYQPLMQTLITFCPEVDWTKLLQWINHYKLRRRSRDFLTYLRAEDIESFIDYMLKYHPVKNLGDIAKKLDAHSLEKDLVVYFSKWDAILMKERVKREVARLAKKQPSASTSSIPTLLPPVASESNDPQSQSPPSHSSHTPDCNSPQASPGATLKKDNGFELPKKKRLLITKFVEDSIDRVTRAMLAIHTTMYGEKRGQTPDQSDEPEIEKQTNIIGSNIQQPSPEAEPDSRVSSPDDTENRVPTSPMSDIDITMTKPICLSSPTKSLESSSSSPSNKQLSPQEKEAMKKYLLAHDLIKKQAKEAGQSVDGTFSLSSSFRQRLTEAKRPHSAFCFKAPKTELADPIYSPPIWQPKPVSPHTQAKIYSMHQYNVTNDNYVPPLPTEPQSRHENNNTYATFPRSNAAYPSFPIMNYLWEYAVPIGPETTPHIAMFANQRREREREDADTMLRNCF
ncbi:hypothetical protein EYR41_001945 [Orbilia oligospora]|uniref:Uncharacterized protein n=1 Tax=Orbilia oligospora TaxID=2813651 RepID=A0A8H2ECD8_ORBOL|nr:hypothetical protein EYR41_001945 [Orbilia oligospora]